LAFGAKGSSSGIVPPYSTLIYKVKLENVGI
jgi:FKBP-type peptidyl-prolyl cis-trans isomerase